VEVHKNKIDISQVIKVMVPFAILFCLYVLIGSYGFGNDCDTYEMIRAGQKLMTSGIYAPSRPPGLFLPDIFIGLSSYIGGSLFSNMISSIFAVMSLYILRLLLKNHFDDSDAFLIVAIIGLNPHFIIAASSTIDYIYSIFFGLCGIKLFYSNRPFLSATLFGCAVASRLGNGLIIALIYLYFVYVTCKNGGRREQIRIIISIGLAVFVTVCLFVPIYKSYDNTFAFLTYYIEDWTYFEHLSRLLYKNIYLFGLLPFLLLSGHTMLSIVQKQIVLSPAILFGLLIVIVHELLFLKIPLEISYLLPLLFVIVPCWVFVCKPKRIVIFGLLATTITYGFFAKLDILDIHYNKAGNVAVAADIGMFLRPGLIINDIQRRPESEMLYFQKYRLNIAH
jgi:hypothetical protein